MKKFINLFIAPVMIFCLGLCFTSCSNDDDDNGGNGLSTDGTDLKYEITTPDSQYSWIELTSGGNYIVMTPEYMDYYYAPAKQPMGPASRSYMEGVYFGSYTKISENEYKLNDFGTVTVNIVDDNAYSLTITRGSSTTTLSATIEKEISSSSLTNSACGKWDLSTFGETWYLNGKKIFDMTVPRNKIKDIYIALAEQIWTDPDEFDIEDWDPDHFAKQMIITKNGTYLTIFNNNEIKMGYWIWINESKGLIATAEDLQDFEDGYYEEGKISINGKKLTLVSEDEWDEDEGHIKLITTFGLTPAK